MDSKTIPFTYLIGWSAYNKWYYGVRYAKGCSPKDLWKTYFTSSRVVKQFRKDFGEPDVIQIRKTFTSKKSATMHEYKVLNRLDASNNTKFLNKCNGVPIITKESITSWRLFYNPEDGIIMHFKGTTQQLPYKKFKHIHKTCETFPITLGKSVPSKFKIRINDGNKTIVWDSRIELPCGWIFGYLYSNNQRAAAIESGKRTKGISKPVSLETREKMKENHWTKNGHTTHPLLGVGHTEASKEKMSESAAKYDWCFISPSGFIFDGVKSLPKFCDNMNLSVDSMKKFANTNSPVTESKYKNRAKPTQKFNNTLGWFSFKTPLF